MERTESSTQADGPRYKGSTHGRKQKIDTDAGRLLDLVDGGNLSYFLITSGISVIHETRSSGINEA